MVCSAVTSMKFVTLARQTPFAGNSVLYSIRKNALMVYVSTAFAMKQKDFIMKTSPVYPTLMPEDASNILKTEMSWPVIHRTQPNTECSVD